MTKAILGKVKVSSEVSKSLVAQGKKILEEFQGPWSQDHMARAVWETLRREFGFSLLNADGEPLTGEERKMVQQLLKLAGNSSAFRQKLDDGGDDKTEAVIAELVD